MHVKGMELPGYDPRGALGLGLSYGTSNRGACHLRAYMVAPEILRKPKALDRMTLQSKAGYLYVFQNRFTVADCLGICKFALFAVGEEELADILSALSGVEYTAEGLLRTGERVWNLERLYNVREGFSVKDDMLPERFYTEPADGLPPVDRDEYAAVLREYYRCRGWDDSGRPLPQTVEALGLDV